MQTTVDEEGQTDGTWFSTEYITQPRHCIKAWFMADAGKSVSGNKLNGIYSDLRETGFKRRGMKMHVVSMVSSNQVIEIYTHRIELKPYETSGPIRM